MSQRTLSSGLEYGWGYKNKSQQLRVPEWIKPDPGFDSRWLHSSLPAALATERYSPKIPKWSRYRKRVISKEINLLQSPEHSTKDTPPPLDVPLQGVLSTKLQRTRRFCFRPDFCCIIAVPGFTKGWKVDSKSTRFFVAGGAIVVAGYLPFIFFSLCCCNCCYRADIIPLHRCSIPASCSRSQSTFKRLENFSKCDMASSSHM